MYCEHCAFYLRVYLNEKNHERQELNLNYELFHALSFKTAKTQTKSFTNIWWNIML